MIQTLMHTSSWLNYFCFVDELVPTNDWALMASNLEAKVLFENKESQAKGETRTAKSTNILRFPRFAKIYAHLHSLSCLSVSPAGGPALIQRCWSSSSYKQL